MTWRDKRLKCQQCAWHCRRMNSSLWRGLAKDSPLAQEGRDCGQTRGLLSQVEMAVCYRERWDWREISRGYFIVDWTLQLDHRQGREKESRLAGTRDHVVKCCMQSSVFRSGAYLGLNPSQLFHNPVLGQMDACTYSSMCHCHVNDSSMAYPALKQYYWRCKGNFISIWWNCMNMAMKHFQIQPADSVESEFPL